MKQKPIRRQHYDKHVTTKLKESFGIENVMEVPRL